MNKQELIKMLNRTIEDYTNKDGFGRGVRTGLSMSTFAIKRLDEPEKIVIPQFVADWWDGDSVTMYGGERINKKYKLRLISEFHDRGLGDYLSKVEDWLDENDSTFLDLVNGKPYEVEKEKLYYAKIKGHELIDTEPILDDYTGKDVSEWNRNIYFIQQLNKEIVIDMKDSGLRGAKHFMTIKEWAELGINETNAEFEPVEVAE